MQDFTTNIDFQSSLPVQQGLNLTGLLQTLKRNALPIAGISTIATLIFYLTNSSTPTYTGDFQLLVEPVTLEAKFSEPSTLTSSSKNENIAPLEMDYSTIITILKSPGMLSSIVEQVQTEYPSFTQKQLKDNLQIERLNLDESDLSNQTKIIAVSYKESDPKLVDLVLQKTADKYLRYSLEDRKTQISQGIDFIEDQLPDLSKRTNELQTRLQHLREKNQFIDPQLKGEDLLKQVSQVNLQQLETKEELQKLIVLKQNLEKQLQMSPEQAILSSGLSENSNYQQLLEKLKSLESEISTQTALFQNNTPQIQALYDQQKNLKNLLNQENKRILGQNFESSAGNSPLLKFQNSVSLGLTQQLVETTNKIKVLETQLTSLKTTQNQLEQQAQQLPSVSRQYTELQQELSIANQTLDQLSTQRDGLRIELAQSQVPWEIVSSPQLLQDSTGNPTPLPQNAEKQLMMSLIGSLFLGIGTSIFFEKSRNIFYNAEDIEQQSKSPLLGVVSLNKDQDSPPNDVEFSDAFDALYANIKFRFDDPSLHSVVITSVLEKDERTPIALYLAETAAAMGQKVLLVDANLRSPSLHAELNLPNQKGLCDLLMEQSNVNYQDVIQKSTQKTNLFILTSGQVLPNSTRMLASTQMKNLNQEFQETFDLIIYDTASFLSCMDTSFLAAHTDGIMMVVEVGKTQKYLVEKASTQMESFKLNNLGVIAILPD
jgi:polysaccharide biosynthesis transport protein